MTFSTQSDAAPVKPLRFLFIHHSCGGQLLAAPGPDEGTNCIYSSHPNGGGLRAMLETNSYELHEASYGSKIGENTDIFDWLPKFRDEMEEILAYDMREQPTNAQNNIVAFKSCFPNNCFVSEGIAPGNPVGPELTVWNAKATYKALLNEFRKYPHVLFVCFTTPPLAFGTLEGPLWKVLAKKIVSRKRGLDQSGQLARQFNNWLAATNGWLKDYLPKNVVVFNYYDILTGYGASDFCVYPSAKGHDSHPNSEGNQKAAEAFVPLLNRAVQCASVALDRKTMELGLSNAPLKTVIHDIHGNLN